MQVNWGMNLGHLITPETLDDNFPSPPFGARGGAESSADNWLAVGKSYGMIISHLERVNGTREETLFERNF